jgi:glycosyltransferase involved in cell wall biosynthesis
MNRRVRILTIGHSYCIALNRALIREVAQDPEFEVTAVAPRFFHGDLRPVLVEPEPPGSAVRLVPLKTHCSRFVHIFTYDHAALRALIQQSQFDLVHAWEEPYILAGYQIARVLKDSSARFCFRTAQSYIKRYPPPFNYIERAVLARSQGWIAGASLVYQAMLARGFPKEQGQILNLAVDLTEFRPLPPEVRCQVQQELNLKPPVIGFVGRLTKAKGLDVLMKAMEQVGGRSPWSLLLLGSGEYEDRVHAWAQRNAWSDRVKILLAKHAEVPRYLGSMDILVAPSQTMKNWREQFGRMIIEAFACGAPVIASDSGEIPHVVGDAGYIVPESDPSLWAQTINRVLHNSEEREELRRRGFARVSRYSVTSVAQKYRDFYRWLANQPLRACRDN